MNSCYNRGHLLHLIFQIHIYSAKSLREVANLEIIYFLSGFTQESGDLVWEYNIGNPISASACVDEHLQLVPETSISPDRYEK